jgi:hypothetical protein
MTFNLWDQMRLLSAFLLITAFVALSYCPLRRTIQNLISGTHETEQSGTGRQVATVVCQGIMAEPKPEIIIPVFTTIVLLLFYSIRQFASSESDFIFQRTFSIAYLTSVPIYLRNRILLI